MKLDTKQADKTRYILLVKNSVLKSAKMTDVDLTSDLSLTCRS